MDIKTLLVKIRGLASERQHPDEYAALLESQDRQMLVDLVIVFAEGVVNGGDRARRMAQFLEGRR